MAPRSGRAHLMLVLGLGLSALGVLAVVGASALGWFGIAQVCGADRALGCVAWPMPISLLVWAAFLVGVVALLIWQVCYLDRG